MFFIKQKPFENVFVTEMHSPFTVFFWQIPSKANYDYNLTFFFFFRNTAWVSFDGRLRQELCHGDSLIVNTSIYPIPSICAQVNFVDVSLEYLMINFF